MKGRTTLARFGAVLVLAALASCSSQAGPAPEPPATATTAPAPPQLAGFYDQTVTWKPCGGSNMCAEVSVPLNYADPAARSINISVIKVPAADPAKRIGALFVNPGGPGGSGISYAKQASVLLSPAVTAAYDVVGLDPRGVGKSTPIECMNDAQTQRFVAVMGTPHDAAQLASVGDVARTVGASCEQNSASLTPFVGTVPTVRDMDILRGVMAEPKLNFLGKSYGTFMGLTYAELFADKVGRFVLDGVIDPSLSNEQLTHGQADGFQLALSRFIQNCPKHKDCPLPTGQHKALAKIQAFLARLVTKPLPAAPGRPLTQPLAVNAFIATMYENIDGWPALRGALGMALDGDGSLMLDLVDAFTGREPDGTYRDNAIDALYAVNCLDRTDRADIAQTQALAADWAKTAPTYGSDLAWGNLPCNSWPAPATDAPHPITGAGAPPIVLVATTYDPATPYDWAVATSKQLIDSSLITWHNDGHTGYGRGSRCVDALVDGFLVSGTVPPKSSDC